MESKVCQCMRIGSKHSEKGAGPLISKHVTCGVSKWVWGHNDMLMDMQVDQ